MKISTIFYTFRQGIANIWRNKLFSLASIATISACLFLFGLFYAVIANFQHIVQTAEKGVSVTVFFHDENDLCEKHEHLVFIQCVHSKFIQFLSDSEYEGLYSTNIGCLRP